MSVEKFPVLDDGHSPAVMAGLLERVAIKDRMAFQQLYTYASPRLYGIALALTRDPHSATEALQDAMLQIWQNAALYDPAKGSAEAWMTGVLRFRSLDILAAGKRRIPANNDLDQVVELADEAALERLESSTAGQQLKTCLGQLEQKNRQSIVLAYVHGYSHSEIAQRLEIPLGTIKAWIRRGLSSLRDCFGS